MTVFKKSFIHHIFRLPL